MSLKSIIEKLEKEEKTKVLTYITNDFPAGWLWTSVASDVIPIFKKILKKQWIVEKRTLILNTNWWSLDAVRPIVSLIREFTTKTFDVIILSKSLSAGTLISLGADNIIMSRWTFLSPIDPATNISFNNGNWEQIKKMAIEDVMWYIKFSKEKIWLKKEENLVRVLDRITNECSPTMLGSFDRTHRQIRSLAKKLLELSSWKKDIKNISKYLIEELYSHNHLINRNEAKEIWLKNVVFPSDHLEWIIDEVYLYYRDKMFLDENKTALTKQIAWATSDLEIMWANIFSQELSYKFIFKWSISQEWTWVKNFNIVDQTWIEE